MRLPLQAPSPGPQPAPPPPDPLAFFRLRPIRAARVSEVSETTAAAPVPAEDRINFHIGNPLQDPRLSSAFLRAALGIDVRQAELRDAEPEAILKHLGWQDSARPALDFLIRTIQRSSPYMPRGGYYRENPHALIRAFCSWLERSRKRCPTTTASKAAGGKSFWPRAVRRKRCGYALLPSPLPRDPPGADPPFHRHAARCTLRPSPTPLRGPGRRRAARRQLEQIILGGPASPPSC